MPIKNLWGELPPPDMIRTPYHILREQAALLEEMTQNLLVGEVDRNTNFGVLRLSLRIVAPTLNNYSYTVLDVEHDVITVYPVFIASHMSESDEFRVKCENEDKFVQELGRILSSERAKKVISGLLSQVKS
jgi:hypothetical protein